MSGGPIQDVCEDKVFDRIFREQSPDLYRFLYHKFGAGNNPEDLVQEAFVQLWKNCKKVTPEKARSYLFTVANNKMLNVLDRKKTELKYRTTIPKDAMSQSAGHQLEEDEFKTQLMQALNDLPEGQRVAFLLNRAEGKKHREIAEMLNISQKAVEKRIYKAADFLLKRLGKKI